MTRTDRTTGKPRTMSFTVFGAELTVPLPLGIALLVGFVAGAAFWYYPEWSERLPGVSRDAPTPPANGSLFSYEAAPIPKSLEESMVIRRARGGVPPFEPIASQRDVIRSGDHIHISFQGPDKAYWYVFQMDAAKQIVMHFPGEGFPPNPVPAGMLVQLPGAGRAYAIDEKTGTESFYFLRTTQPEQPLESFAMALADLGSELERETPRAPGEGVIREASGQDVEAQLHRIISDLQSRCLSCVRMAIFPHH